MGNKMSEYLNLKSVSEILKKEQNFYIPSYQRGYKWGKSQVEKLLEDIDEFSKNKTEEEFYPLQPVVVFKKEENELEIIDGQQRITTIYIILKYLMEERKKNIEKNNSLPKITYETRENSEKFLEQISNNVKDKNLNLSNPDFYYMSSAYITIKNWFEKNSVNFDTFISTLLNDTKVIWYEIKIDDEEKSKEEIENEKRDIFARLNIGKIELTNAELIRALLLNNITDYKKDCKKQIEIETGYQLDKIEYSLRDELFWCFLEETDRDTKIDLIYELLADSYKDELKSNEDKKKFNKRFDKKYSFYVFEYILKNNIKNEEAILSDIKRYFRYLEEWFYDKKFYHKIGYLLTATNIKILKLIENYQESNKEKFREFLNGKIRESIEKVNLEELRYGTGKDNEIRKILLLFNIQTILNNKNSTYKFDFKNFKSRTDDIEHIASQTDKDIKGKDKEEWIEALFKIYGETELGMSKAEAIEKCEKFDEFYEKIAEKLNLNEKIKDDLKNSIGNLTLLDSKINRSYQNSFFPVKRAFILQKDIEGKFLPPCTKNVFLKVYSKNIKNMMNWDENDIESHKNAIKETIKQYLGGNNE
jgi:hypothetical protein